MPLPGVEVNVSDGNLGRTVATEDGVAALILTGIAATSLALNVPTKITSLKDATDKGIAADTHPHAYGQIAGFYAKALDGATLYIMLVAEATTYPSIFTQTTGPMAKLLAYAKGKITIAGISMGRAVGYAPVMVGNFDFDLPAVAAAAQVIASGQAAKFSPINIILDGTYLISPLPGVITSYRGIGDYVSVFTGVTSEGSKRAASMGEFLGQLAILPVQRSIARVNNGSFCTAASLTSGNSLDTYSDGQLGDLLDAGIMALREFTGFNGFYITDDITLAATESDFTSLARRRIANKAVRVTYQTYVQDLNDEIDVGDDGNISPTAISAMEDKIVKALKTRMVNEGNCTKVDVYIDPTQDVIGTDRLEIKLMITVKGYLKKIVVTIGLYNPANA